MMLFELSLILPGCCYTEHVVQHKGEPIVNTPVDAVRCFYGTGIDALAMPPYLFMKESSPEEKD